MKFKKRISNIQMLSTLSAALLPTPFIANLAYNNTNEFVNETTEIDTETSVGNNLSVVNIPDEQELESDQKWIDTIKESEQNHNVKLFFTRNASLVYQQSLLALQYFLVNSDFYISNNEKDKISFFIDEDVYDLNKFDLSSLEEKIMVVKNSNDIINKLGTTVEEEYENLGYSIFPTDYFLELIDKYYKNLYGEDVKYDIWIPDISLTSIWSKGSDSYFYKMLPNISKIYLLSDGNAQTYTFIKKFISNQNKNYLNDEKMLENLSILLDKNIDENTRKNIFKETSLYNYLRTNFFTIFHISRYVDSPYYDIDKSKMYTSYIANYDYYDLSHKLFETNQTEKINDFTNHYEMFFKINNFSLESFVYDGYENYDPSKKNIIWMGDSLIRKEEHVNSQRKEEIQKIFLMITKKYSPDEYNYFFKHHPYYSSQHQKELTNFIIEQSTDVKPIYFSNFPWELFLSWDNKYKKENPEYESFFGVDTNNDSIPKTQLVGVQYTTTTVLSTYFYLLDQYDMSFENAWKSIDYENFPVPVSFNIIKRDANLTDNYGYNLRTNINNTNEIYFPYVELNKLPYYKENQTSSYQALDKLDIGLSFMNGLALFKMNFNLDLFLLISIPLTLVLISTSIVTFVFLKKRKNKKAK